MDCSNLKPGNTWGEASGEAEVMMIEECGTKRKRVESDDSPVSRGSPSAVEELRAKIQAEEMKASFEEEEEATEALKGYLWEGVDMKGVPLRRFLSLMRWAVDQHKADIEAGVDTQRSKKLPYKKLAEAYAERMEESWRWQLAFYRLLRESNRRHIEAWETAITVVVEEKDLEKKRASERTALRLVVEDLRREKEKGALNLASAEAGLKKKEETLSKERGARMELEGRCRRLTVALDQLKLRRKQEEELWRKDPQRAPKMVEVSTNTEAREEGRGQENPVRPARNAATSTEDAQEETEGGVPLHQVGVDLGFLKAIDAIVVRRLREMGGPGRGGSERVGESGAAPPFPTGGEGTWAQRVGRNAPKKGRRAREVQAPLRPAGTKTKRGGVSATDRPRKAYKRTNRGWPSLPKTAAVTLTIPPGGEGSYAQVMASVREAVSLEELGIPHLEVRKARTGAVVLGVPGDDSSAKADRLADRMAEATKALGVRIAQPARRMDLRIARLGLLASAEEVLAAIVRAGGCREEDVRCRRAGGSSFSSTAWAQCPAEAALRLAKEGSIMVGRVRATVELLPARPLRCHRCLELGHVRA